MDIFTLETGTAPLLVSLPHDGSHIPPELAARLCPAARSAPDTDWFVSRLYGFARDLGASILRPTHSRYVVDLNRPPDDGSLYPGQNTTGLCPVVRFSGEPVYLDGQAPELAEINARVDRYWRPYHAALAGELTRLRQRFARVVVWEGHSIRARLPFLFPGCLPDLNLGTVGGSSCSARLRSALVSVLEGQTTYSQVVDGRFKGGYITRHYGRPDEGVEAVQLELAQATYMDEATVGYLPGRADALRQQVLEPLLRAALAHALA